MEQLGIDAKLFVAQMVNFLIILFVLTKVLYKPILAMLEKRKEKIEQGLKFADKMKSEEAKFEDRKQKMMEQARNEAKDIIEQGKKRAKEVEKEMLKDSRNEAKKIIQKGKQDVKKLHDDMRAKIQKESVTLAVAMSKRLLGSIMSPKEQHKLIQQHISKLKRHKA